MSNRKCYRCGKTLSVEGDFCPFCGAWVRTKIRGTVESDAPNRTSEKVANRGGHSEQQRSVLIEDKHRLFIRMCCFVLLTVIVSLVVLTIHNSTTEMGNSSIVSDKKGTVPAIGTFQNPQISNNSQKTELVELPLPQNGEILGGILAKAALNNPSTLSIKTSSMHTFVKLKDKTGSEVLTFFVRANSYITVNVPATELLVYYAQGNKWYGVEECFGDDTIYYKDNNICDFSQYSWEYSFDKTVDGNFSPVEITEKGF